MENDLNVPEIPDLAESLHSIFLESMEARYKETLTFFGFIVPSITGFMWLMIRYTEFENSRDFLQILSIGVIAILLILFWGAVYALASSYRYRSLQACVYLIEEYCGSDRYIPKSFKPERIQSLRKRLSLSIAPGILQIQIFFILLSSFAITAFYVWLTPYTYSNLLIMFIFLINLIFVYYLGGWYYTGKLNHIVEDLENRKRSTHNE